MSYDPSRRVLPPRQGGWPQATPPRAWPAYRDASAYRDADQAADQDEARGEGSYWADASSQPQPDYQGQSAYQRELAHQGQAAYRGQSGYQAQPGYEPEPGYQGERGYESEPGYQGRPAYESEPGYQGQRAYQGQAGYGAKPGYQAEAAYGAEPGYQAEAAYGVRPGYQAEPGYQDAFDGSDDHEYRDYRPTRVIDPWPAAPDGYAHSGGGHDDHSGVAGYYGEPADAFDGGGYGVATDGFDAARNGYGAPDAYADYGNGTGWSSRDNQDTSRGGYGLDVADGYGLDVADEYGLGADGAAGDGHRDWGYAESGASGASGASGTVLTAPDAGMLPHHWRDGRDRRREQKRRGVMVGAVTGFLAAAVVIGVTTLAAAIVRPPVSPVVAVGDVLIDRTPAALRNLVAAHFGSHGRAALLLGLYLVIAVLAMTLGVLTRRAPALGVACVGAGAVVAAFVTITRPQSGPGEVIPWIIGGIAGAAALLWLVRSSTPATPVRPALDTARGTARGGNRRRAR
jgi:hypothetical protein